MKSETRYQWSWQCLRRPASRAFARAVLVIAAAGVMAFAAACGAVGSSEGVGEGVEVHDAWVRPAPEGGMTAAYMAIDNHGDAGDRLVAVSMEGVQAVEIHETVMEGDVARMVHLPEGLPLPADSTVELKPMSYHVMLMGLQSALQAGDTATLTLEFEVAEPLNVEAEVRSMADEVGTDE